MISCTSETKPLASSSAQQHLVFFCILAFPSHFFPNHLHRQETSPSTTKQNSKFLIMPLVTQLTIPISWNLFLNDMECISIMLPCNQRRHIAWGSRKIYRTCQQILQFFGHHYHLSFPGLSKQNCLEPLQTACTRTHSEWNSTIIICLLIIPEQPGQPSFWSSYSQIKMFILKLWHQC